MLFTLETDDGDFLELRDAQHGNEFGAYIMEEGISGWYGSPAPREEVFGRAETDGDGMPVMLTQGARIVTLECVGNFESAIDAANYVSQITSLMCKPLTLTCHDGGGRKHAKGFISDDPEIMPYPDEESLRFTLIITCPDPFRYADPIEYPVQNGKATVINTGNAPTWPKIKILGTSFSAKFDGHEVDWFGSVHALVDFRDPSKTLGVTLDDVFQIPPGIHTIEVSASGNASVIVESAWR